MKKGNVFWGIVLVLGAILILLQSFKIYLGIAPFRLFAGVVLAAWLFKSILDIQVEGICFSAAFLFIIFGSNLVGEPVNGIQILFVALLLSVGLNLIFGDRIKKLRKNRKENGGMERYGQVVDSKEHDHVEVGVKCGSVVKYIESDNFVSGDLSASFGELVVYFDNAVIQNPSASVDINVSFGNLKLYIPKMWKIENNVTSSFAGVDERGHCQWTEGGKVLYLKGSVSFGAVEIYYI